jgi:hypothetical protein
VVDWINAMQMNRSTLTVFLFWVMIWSRPILSVDLNAGLSSGHFGGGAEVAANHSGLRRGKLNRALAEEPTKEPSNLSAKSPSQDPTS